MACYRLRRLAKLPMLPGPKCAAIKVISTCKGAPYHACGKNVPSKSNPGNISLLFADALAWGSQPKQRFGAASNAGSRVRGWAVPGAAAPEVILALKGFGGTLTFTKNKLGTQTRRQCDPNRWQETNVKMLSRSDNYSDGFLQNLE